MMDSYVSFANANHLDSFPSFKRFDEQPSNDQGAFTVDERDRVEMQPTPPPAKKINANPSVQCDICLVPISSEIVYKVHIAGKKHQAILTALLTKNPEYKPLTYEELCSKKQEPVVLNNPSESSESSAVNLPVIASNQFVCPTCNISCNSQQMFDKHVTGKKHQMKLKMASVSYIKSVLHTSVVQKTSNPAPVRNVPDNNPSSSNYCDVCSLQLKSENELTEHLALKRHQTKVKEAEICAKAAVDMKINFDDYKILNPTAEKNAFNYECIRCNKKMSDKMQLINHLKSSSHIRLGNQANKEVPPKTSKRGKYPPTRGGIMRGGLAARNHAQPSTHGSNKPTEKPRSYRNQRPPRNQSYPEQTSENPFGAFDPYNEASYSSDHYSYPSTKRPAQYEEIPSGYDGFYPKRSRTYDDRPENSEEYYANYPPWNTNSYPPQNFNYPDQSDQPNPSWQYPNDPYSNQEPYSNPELDYTNSTYYPPTQPPLPNYEPPPLPNYPPPPPPDPYYAQHSTYPNASENPPDNPYYPPSYPY